MSVLVVDPAQPHRAVAVVEDALDGAANVWLVAGAVQGGFEVVECVADDSRCGAGPQVVWVVQGAGQTVAGGVADSGVQELRGWVGGGEARLRLAEDGHDQGAGQAGQRDRIFGPDLTL